MSPDGVTLDQTTYYSVLGLPFDATDAQIRKSYMKLARELHPDKSKSEVAAELFKVVAHAHSILTDREKRLKYDRSLIVKGLHRYVPKKSSVADRKKASTGISTGTSTSTSTSTSKPTPKSTNGTTKKDTSYVAKTTADAAVPTPKSKPRQSRPYEEKPYGFGIEDAQPLREKPPAVKTPISKPFKAKSYEHQQQHQHQHQRQAPHADGDSASKKSSTYSARFASSSSGPETPGASAASLDEDVKIKMPRKELAGDTHGTETPESPFLSSHHRHYARTMHHSKQQDRRSASPVKNRPNTNADSLQSVKDIMDKFNRSTPGKEDKPRRPSVSKETPTPQEKRQTQDFVPGFPDGQEPKTVIPDGAHGQDPREQEGSAEAPRPQPRQAKKHTLRSKEIVLDELTQSLPFEENHFDMRQVSDTLEHVRVKRPKLDKHYSPEVEMLNSQDSVYEKREFSYPQPTDTLYKPVNQPLPRIYKPDLIPENEYAIDPSVALAKLPSMPAFQCNILDKSEVERCRHLVENFHTECASLKKKLISVLLRRSAADELLGNRMLRPENTSALVRAKSYDIDIVTKLAELQNRQRIVAESFSNLMKSVYASRGA